VNRFRIAATVGWKSSSINLNMIGLDGRPAVKNLLEILTECIDEFV
jgi:hypothetical protein